MLATVRRPRDHDLIVPLLDLDVAVDPLGQLALRTVHGHPLRLDRDRHTRGHRDWLPADSRHRYQTLATSSPPIPCCRASWPVITPREVDTIVVPMPPWIRGMCAWSTYVRRPGRDTR